MAISADILTSFKPIDVETEDALLQTEIDADHEEWVQTLTGYTKSMAQRRNPDPMYVDPAAFVRKLSEKMDENGIYVADVGQNQIWSCRNYQMRDGSFLTSGGMGTMGYSIPAAMGAKLGCPDRQAVAVCGDGSFQMSMCELATMRQHGAAAKVVVMKNGFLGMVREYQTKTYNNRFSVVDLSGSPDLSKIAEAYGIPFIRVTNMREADEAIERFLEKDETVLMEILVHPLDMV
jgi:acetolactate synthase-1/2/3 large subunit